MNKNVLIEILVGLPGSGKTHYAKEFGVKPDMIFSSSNCGLIYVDFDKDREDSISRILKNHNFANTIKYKKKDYEHWIFDGLFLTNEAQDNVIAEIYRQLSYAGIKLSKQYEDRTVINIQFVYFKEDREACLFNDKVRNRETLADIMIKGADYEKPDIDALSDKFKEFNFTLVEKEVHKMTLYESKFKIHENKYGDEDIMRSEEWSLGGSWGDCWSNSGSVSADKQPSSFVEFDDLLCEICPNIPFLQYKKLYNYTVKIETKDEYDYYGGHTQYAYFTCDLKKLYDMMLELGVIKEE